MTTTTAATMGTYVPPYDRYLTACRVRLISSIFEFLINPIQKRSDITISLVKAPPVQWRWRTDDERAVFSFQLPPFWASSDSESWSDGAHINVYILLADCWRLLPSIWLHRGRRGVREADGDQSFNWAIKQRGISLPSSPPSPPIANLGRTYGYVGELIMIGLTPIGTRITAYTTNVVVCCSFTSVVVLECTERNDWF